MTPHTLRHAAITASPNGGIDGRASRRAALLHLAARLPAAVLSELLGFSNSAAVTWVHDAGGDWSRYAADLAQQRAHQPAE